MVKGFLAYTRGVRSSIVSNILLVSSFCARALSEFETIKAKLSQLLKKKKKIKKEKEETVVLAVLMSEAFEVQDLHVDQTCPANTFQGIALIWQ